MAKKKKKKSSSRQPELNVNIRRKRRTQAFIIFDVIFFVASIWLALMAGTQMHYAKEDNVLSGIVEVFSEIGNDISTLWDIRFTDYTATALLFCIGFWAIASALLWYDDVRHRHDLADIEKGSARLNDNYKGFNADYSEDDKMKCTYLSQNVALSMDTRKTLRNNNVLIIGGSGAGKTRFFVKPNILQTNCNMVITDPSGELLESCGTYLKQEGYTVKVFNLVEMNKSNCYNPFHYIRDDQGVIMMINCLIKNTTPPESSSNDPFWEKSETALLQALCFYLKEHRPEEEQNFAMIMELLRWAEVDERNPDFESKLDRVFLKSKKKNQRSAASIHGVGVGVNITPEDVEFNKYLARTHYKDENGEIQENIGFKSLEELDTQGTDIAVKQYKIFKMGAGKTAKSILISCAVRLTVFNLPQLARLTGTDDIHLEDLGGTNPNKKKQALFVIIPAADSTFNFLVSMMYSQLFETLYFVAETSPACNKKRLPMHVKFLLDEFANIGTIPEFTKKLATMRKYEISCSVILQNLAQIKTMYKDDWESIVGNCDSMVFLGGKEFTTLEYLSKELGFQTIVGKSRTMQAASQKGGGHDSHQYQTDKRELMTPDELGNMDNARCVVQIRGLDPFLDYKFDYLQHPRYKYTSDCNPELTYVNPLDNMKQTPQAQIEMVSANIANDQANKAAKIFSLEEMIKNNPNWNDYPSIFSEFRTVPATPAEEDDEINDAFEAALQNPPITPAPTTPATPSDSATKTLADALQEFAASGKQPSESLAQAQSSVLNNFFDDEDD
jgi:type IV secretion system protein VirD4